MGGGVSRREPEVHVVVVQSQENGKMEAKLLSQNYTSLSKGGGGAPVGGGQGRAGRDNPKERLAPCVFKI